ncbi:hypothetical protein METBIDRAFT_33171 [Metschnikowia bicuspidata var. bicuspidata NRRL YB-4993]|uniref:Uncharacterized protein n=1 Tax=Metschnikowia bicuspidata var. bicuspidata NRRL YB-4993 TaxID=869754 RepID=A0A1A0H6A8_9ASCO|nr:hypothetical protein METBIDRAFT_33171 [Metschnikowia bicuspidata var. bicuspidata NRRL YB-4993]OBA19495.1 hypothetical protein METBIDRAFT_33171 [Metschnikowia bicuspidata var. bicuspidata NRRL YB-4993]
MESLTAYSSDDSSLDSGHVRGISPSSLDKPNSENHNESTQNDDSCDFPDKLTDLYHRQGLEAPIILYLQEYSMNAKRQITAFAYLPWQPSREVKTRLRAASDKAIHVIREKVVNFDKRFAHNSVVAAKSVAHGVFGHTNKRSLTDLHVSLFPNISLPQNKLKPFLTHVQRAVKPLQVPSEILATQQLSALDRMLSEGKATGKKLLRLQLDSRLHLYKLTKSGSIFVGIGLSKYADEKREQLLPQFKYLTQISGAIENEAKLLNFDYNWMQFSLSKSDHARELLSLYYHFTLVICELHPRGQRMTEAEFEQTKQWLNEVDVSTYLENMYFEADHFVVSSGDLSKKVDLF